MKKVEATIGYRVYDDNGKFLGYMQDRSDEGYIFKDENAFKNNPDEICYISEYGFEMQDKNGILAPKYAKDQGETRNTIRKLVKSYWGEDYLLTDKQIDYIAEDVFYLAEWAYITTYLAENFEIEDIIQFDYEDGKGLFSKKQYDAVMNGKFPREWHGIC